MVAAAKPHRTAEDEALIAEAREKARQGGTLEAFDQLRSNLDALHDRDPAAGSELADQLDEVIGTARIRTWIADPTFELALQKAFAPAVRGGLGHKYARQAAVLLRLGDGASALTAAKAALTEFRALPEVDPDAAGLYAYSALTAAEALLAADEAEEALRAADEAVALFRDARRIPPECAPDAVRALVVLAECQAATGQAEQAGQSGRQAMAQFMTMPRTSGPQATPGSMPSAWGLPIINERALDELAERVAALPRV
jgi:tetratricopeptide (TPR) repeat protein